MHTEPDLSFRGIRFRTICIWKNAGSQIRTQQTGNRHLMIKREAKADRQTAAGSVPQNTKSDRQITGGAKKSWKRFLPARTEKLKEGFRPSRNIAEYMSQLPSRSIVLQNRKKRKKNTFWWTVTTLFSPGKS